MTVWEPSGSGDPVVDGICALAELETLAADRLAGPVWDYVAGGAGDQVSLRDNPRAWARHRLLPHVLRDVSGLSTATHLLGQDLAHPILAAPTATHARYHPGAERETLGGVAAAESILTLSSLGSTLPRDLGRAAGELASPWWMQVYLQQDRSHTHEYLDRAVAAGACALVLTVDTPSLGARDRDKRDSFGFSDGIELPTLSHLAVMPDPLPVHRRIWNNHLAHNLTPADITELADRYGVPVLVKGVLRASDARLAVQAGAAGVIVSNHGGRNLDTTPATADVLRAVVDEIGGAVPIIVDGGIRRGTDIAAALCLGADAVMLGRPIIWGLATYGARGVQHALEIARTELEMAMALLGAPSIADLGRDLLVP